MALFACPGCDGHELLQQVLSQLALQDSCSALVEEMLEVCDPGVRSQPFGAAAQPWCAWLLLVLAAAE
jgi:hypothetical protein